LTFAIPTLGFDPSGRRESRYERAGAWVKLRHFFTVPRSRLQSSAVFVVAFFKMSFQSLAKRTKPFEKEKGLPGKQRNALCTIMVLI